MYGSAEGVQGLEAETLRRSEIFRRLLASNPFPN